MPQLVKDQNRWRKAKVPMSATSCTTIELGWKPAFNQRVGFTDQLRVRFEADTFVKAHVLARAQHDLHIHV